MDCHTLSLILSGRMDELDLHSLSPQEWDLLLRGAQAEGVAPLLYWALSQSGQLSSCPPFVQDRLRAVYFSLKMNNEELLKELESLTRLFERAGIPVVALKGACFALTIYPDIGLRPMVDLDLLVPASKRSETLQIARSSGYVDAIPEAFPGLGRLLDHAVCLVKTSAPFSMLELHHTLVAEKSFAHAVPVEWFWSQTEPIEAMSRERRIAHLRMLTPTAQVLYASAHAMLQHGGRNTSLRWYYDLDCLIRVYAGRVNWDLLLVQARSFEWSSAVFAALSQVVSFFDTPVPQNVIEGLSKHVDRNTKRIAILQDQPISHTLEEYEKLKFLNWQGRIRMILALIIPGTAYMRWRYGLTSSHAISVYYLYRWWGILKDAWRTFGVLLQNVFTRVDLEFDRTPGKSKLL